MYRFKPSNLSKIRKTYMKNVQVDTYEKVIYFEIVERILFVRCHYLCETKKIFQMFGDILRGVEIAWDEYNFCIGHPLLTVEAER